jgi:hypothetical protein
MINHKDVVRILHQVLPAEVAGAFLMVLENVDNATDHVDRLQAVYDGAADIKQAALANAEGTGKELFT